MPDKGKTPKERTTACPRCGKFLLPKTKYGDAAPHECSTPIPYRLSNEQPKADHLQPYIEDHPRIVNCPNCKNHLDVSFFDPLENVQCCHCKQNFTLLKSFAGFTLLRSFDAGWHNAVYLGRDEKEGTSAIVKVLSAHVLPQPDSLPAFYQEQNLILETFLPPYDSQFKSGQFCGFHYFVIPLDADLTEEQILISAGVAPAEPEREISREVESRKVICKNCESPIDVSFFDPLDTVKCLHCEDTFELLRNFGDYLIDYRLNSGGTSLLFLAQSSRFKKDVALKILSSNEMQHGQEAVDQFVQECELTKKLIHPNLIQVYDHGHIDGFYFMALELVEGLTLDEILKSVQEESAMTPENVAMFGGNRERYKEALPELICLEMILQAASGLGVAHDQNLVHGDVKPGNVMVTYEGVVKVLDFGLVQFANVEKVFEEGEANPVFGTPIYIPPERVRGEAEDFRSDIYGLGATLYHLLRGVPPFTGSSPVDIALKQATMPAVSFKVYAPWISDTTCRIVEKSLKKSVHERYGSHLEFIADLILAKNQILNNMAIKTMDGRTLLKSFMRALPTKPSSRAWKRAETNAVRTYKYVTKAITQMSFRSRVRKLKKENN
jgi:serine/threonine protein kinase